MENVVRRSLLRRENALQRIDARLAFFQLSRLLFAGVTLSDALDDVSHVHGTRRHRHVWSRVADAVKSGKSFTEALQSVAGTLDYTVMALLKAGEANGRLGSACQSVHEHLQWRHDHRERLITLLIYPLFSVCLLLAVTGFLFVSVVPSIKGFLLSSGASLAWHTQLLVQSSTWISQHFALALFIGAMVITSFLFLTLVSAKARWYRDSCLLRVPVIGRLIVDLSISRYAACCAQLYASGVALEWSLELSERTVGNQVIKSQLGRVRTMMVGGASLTESMQRASMLPPMVTRMISVGESSGQLDEVLSALGAEQSHAAQATIKRIEQMIGPTLLMIVGAMLLWIVVSVLGPVYDLAISTVIGAGR